MGHKSFTLAHPSNVQEIFWTFFSLYLNDYSGKTFESFKDNVCRIIKFMLRELQLLNESIIVPYIFSILQGANAYMYNVLFDIVTSMETIPSCTLQYDKRI